MSDVAFWRETRPYAAGRALGCECRAEGAAVSSGVFAGARSALPAGSGRVWRGPARNDLQEEISSLRTMAQVFGGVSAAFLFQEMTSAEAPTGPCR